MSQSFCRDDVVNEYAQTLIRVKAKQVVRQPGFSRSDQEDIEQDLLVHLLSQAEHFDPERGSINTFVARVVDTGVAMLVRDRNRLKRRPEEGIAVESLEAKVEQPSGAPAPLWATVSHEDLQRRTGTKKLSDVELYELAEGVAQVTETMPPELQQVCRSLLTRNRTETERALKLTRRRFDALVAQIRQHCAEAGLAKS